MQATDVCPGCGDADTTVLYQHDSVPSHGALIVPTLEEAAQTHRAHLRLCFCGQCGLIFNSAFEAYASTYDESQGFSATFRAYADELSDRLISQYGVEGKRIVEIGCGKGDFLALLCEKGQNSGLGIDPSFGQEPLETSAAERLTFVQELYSDNNADPSADLVVCRHTLEHIRPVGEFLRLLRRTVCDDAILFFEVPDMYRILQETAFWDVYYEHCNYFTCGSLTRLVRRAGFDVLDVHLDYGNQYVALEARPSRQPSSASPLPDEEPVDLLAGEVAGFAERVAEAIAHWKNVLARLAVAGRRAVVWGAGSKGVGFLTNVGTREEIPYAVDINPFKQGKYMAGTGQLIVSPEFLEQHRPDLVIVMNPVYLDEIKQSLDAMGVDAELVAV